VAIFGALFASGDRAFAQLAGDVLPDSVPIGDLPARLLVFALVMSFAGGLAQTAALADEPAGRPLLRLGRPEWLLALGALNALFALFVAVQLAVLFGGDAYVRDSAGLTYAQYARSGFAQLVVVAVLTLGVVASALRWARNERARDGAILRALLGTLCVLTLVVLASALHRLGLYEEAYGFTRLRLAVHALLLFGGALFVLVIGALASDRRGWLAQAMVVLAALAALAFWVGDPDRRIATHNVERYEATGKIDLDYMSDLSADAVPALLRLPPPLRERVLGRQPGWRAGTGSRRRTSPVRGRVTRWPRARRSLSAMRATLLAAAAAAVVSLAVAGCGEPRGNAAATVPEPLGPAPASGARAVATAEVSLVDYALDVSDSRVPKAGLLEFAATNDGLVRHALAVDGPAGTVRTAALGLGERGTFTVRLPPGTYKWYCPIADHEQRGMAGRVRVAE